MIKQKQKNLISRPPIVVVLGHIDHGKSSLLEAIKDFKITAKESGGITQHIGAYQITMPAGKHEEGGKKITFIDTPGHEAFSQMRSRGAKVADIAILVVDVAEGVKAQTKEATSHIKKSGIPVIVALNKIDKPEANPEKVKRELSKAGLLVEGLGGKIPSLEISAKTGQGIPELLELILLVAEMEELKADEKKPAQGVVIESYLDNLRGPTATLLLTNGTLKIGDIVGTSTAFTKVKSLENFQKVSISEALPSTPVIIFGFNQVPIIGEEFRVFSDIETAKNYLKIKEKRAPEILEISGEKKVLNLILKTDVAGSAEAIEEILKSLPQEKVVLRILKSEAGSIDESDLKLAKGGKALMLGFRVKIDPVAKKLIEREEIKIMSFEVIYDLIEGIRKLMERIIKPEEVRVDLGRVKVLAKFLAEKNRQIIGGKVVEGEAKKGALIEVSRADEKIGQGKLINLQKNKKDVEVLGKGEDCGILFEGEAKIEEGDILLIYQRERQKI
jgi:translation initiation factor IF-2